MQRSASDSNPASPGRRRFLLASSFLGGYWFMGPAGAQAPATPAAAAPAPGFSPWLRLGPDGHVLAYTNVSDIGQGTWAALRAAVAEQLDVSLEQVTIEHAPLQKSFHNRWIDNYATFGSLGLRTGYATLAPAAAAARSLLVDAAAERLGVPAAECSTRDGAVWHNASQRSLAYTTLLEDASRRVPPAQPALRPRAQWRLLGKPVAAPHAAARVDGSFGYGIDVRRPGQLYAAVQHAPVVGARLDQVDPRPAMKLAGVVKVVPLVDAVAVVASDTWLAQKALAALHLNWTRVERGVRCGYWRSVGYSQNSFFLEHMLDIAARACSQEPLAYRRRLLQKDTRALAFLDALAAAADWTRPLPPGQARGIAIASANGSLSGHVVEVAVTAPGRFRLLRIVAAIDAGVVFDPVAVEAQMSGGTLFGLSAALGGEITFEQGRVVQGNFDSYPLVRMADVPPLTVKVIAGGERPGGVGEEGPPTVAPAIANALLAACGNPVARLPLTRAGWQREP